MASPQESDHSPDHEPNRHDQISPQAQIAYEIEHQNSIEQHADNDGRQQPALAEFERRSHINLAMFLEQNVRTDDHDDLCRDPCDRGGHGNLFHRQPCIVMRLQRKFRSRSMLGRR